MPRPKKPKPEKPQAPSVIKVSIQVAGFLPVEGRVAIKLIDKPGPHRLHKFARFPITIKFFHNGNGRLYYRARLLGELVRIPSVFGDPPKMIDPGPPLHVPREELDREATLEERQAEMKRRMKAERSAAHWWGAGDGTKRRKNMAKMLMNNWMRRLLRAVKGGIVAGIFKETALDRARRRILEERAGSGLVTYEEAMVALQNTSRAMFSRKYIKRGKLKAITHRPIPLFAKKDVDALVEIKLQNEIANGERLKITRSTKKPLDVLEDCG